MDILSKLQLKKNPINEMKRRGVSPICSCGRLEASHGHLGREYGHSVVEDVGQLGVRGIEEREEIKDKAHTKLTLALLRLSKNQRDNLQQFPGGLGPRY